MISSTAARATSLFQFIDDQRPNPPLVNEAGESQPQNEQPQANDPDAKLVNVHGFDDLVDKIMSGETPATADKVGDMLEFYQNQVNSELNNTLKSFDLSDVPEIRETEGTWQLSQEQPNTKLNDFINHLNEDADLSRKLERTLKLSVLNEQIAVKAHAQTLKSQNTLDVDVESFVVKASERLQETRFLTVEQGHLKLGNAGVIKQ